MAPPNATGCDVDADVQRAWRSGARERNVAEAVLADTEAVVDAGWQIDLDFLASTHPTDAVTGVAVVSRRNCGAGTTARWTSGSHLEAALDHKGAGSGTVAGCAGALLGARLESRSCASSASFDRVDDDLALGALARFFKGEVDGGLEVLSSCFACKACAAEPRSALAGPAAPESTKEALKDGACVARIRKATKVLEASETACAEGRRASTAERIKAGLTVSGAVLVIGSALLLVAQQIVGILDLYEALFGALVLVGIWVKFLGEVIVGALDVLDIGVLLDSKNRVRILG